MESDRITVSLSEDSFQVNPGNQVEAVITVQNTGEIVDVLAIEIDGLDETWVELSVNRSSLFPGDQYTSVVTLSPPKESSAFAKTYPFSIIVKAQKHPSHSTIVPANLEVLPFYGFQLSMEPPRYTGVNGRYTVTISNTGNSQITVLLNGNSPDEECQFQFDDVSVQVPPGEKLDVGLTVTPGQRPLRGNPKVYGFEVTASPTEDSLSPLAVSGELAATPRLSRWTILAIAAAVLSVVFVVALVVVLLVTNGTTFRGNFELGPGEDITFPLEDTPDLSSANVKVTANWDGAAPALDVTLLAPESGDSPSETEALSSSSSHDFIISELERNRGIIGWKINVRNDDSQGAAKGDLTWEISKAD